MAEHAYLYAHKIHKIGEKKVEEPSQTDQTSILKSLAEENIHGTSLAASNSEIPSKKLRKK